MARWASPGDQKDGRGPVGAGGSSSNASAGAQIAVPIPKFPQQKSRNQSWRGAYLELELLMTQSVENISTFSFILIKNKL
jgi:hypothetical protein